MPAEFENVKCEIRQRQIKKLQAIQVRSRADKLGRKNQVDAFTKIYTVRFQPTKLCSMNFYNVYQE